MKNVKIERGRERLLAIESNVQLESERTHEISKTVELLAEHTALSSPPRDLAVHEVEHEARDGEDKRGPEVLLVVGHEVLRGHGHGEGEGEGDEDAMEEDERPVGREEDEDYEDDGVGSGAVGGGVGGGAGGKMKGEDDEDWEG